MTLYIVLNHYGLMDEEGNVFIVGVYSTEERARENIERILADSNVWIDEDNFEIYNYDSEWDYSYMRIYAFSLDKDGV